jgi:asparagine synthase (glutamine-hydrolysing)
LASQSVKVILSGVGGDELFGGYRRYLSDSLMPYYKLIPRIVRSKWLPAILARLPQDRHSKWEDYVRLARAFAQSAEMPSALRYMSYITLFSADVREILVRNGTRSAIVNHDETASTVLKNYFDRCRRADSTNQLMYVDMKTSLPDDLLALTDKMTMAASIECRAPLVDHELVELTSRMPSHLKLHGLSMKYLLKKAVSPWLPKEILQRKKRGFGAPIGAWLRQDLEKLVLETLSEEQVKRRGLFNWPIIESVIAAHKNHRSDHTDHLLALINLELWCRIFLDGSDWQSAGAGR